MGCYLLRHACWTVVGLKVQAGSGKGHHQVLAASTRNAMPSCSERGFAWTAISPVVRVPEQVAKTREGSNLRESSSWPACLVRAENRHTPEGLHCINLANNHLLPRAGIKTTRGATTWAHHVQKSPHTTISQAKRRFVLPFGPRQSSKRLSQLAGALLGPAPHHSEHLAENVFFIVCWKSCYRPRLCKKSRRAVLKNFSRPTLYRRQQVGQQAQQA